MFKLLFTIIINLLATVIQIVCLPINAVITNTMPDFSDKILQVTSTLNSVFDSLRWALGLIPDPIIEVLLFIVSVEIAKHTIRVSTGSLIKVWTILQKIKFW